MIDLVHPGLNRPLPLGPRCRRCGRLDLRYPRTSTLYPRFSPALRRPRPTWRRSRPDLRASGDLVQVGSDDLVRVSTNDGVVVAGDTDPCCCQTPLNCSACTDNPSPLTYTVTLSGITLCTTCQTESDESFKASGNANGTFTVAGEGSPPGACFWAYQTFSGPVTVNHYSTFTCTGTPSVSTYFRIELSMNGPDIHGVYITNLRVLGGDRQVFFKSFNRSSGACRGTFTLTDPNGPCFADCKYSGYGGTAVITSD